MNVNNQIINLIIKEQEQIIGPVAWEEAGKVGGLMVDVSAHTVKVEGDSREILERLVLQYQQLFGQASVEVCRDAVRPLLSQLSQEEIPNVLK